MGNRWTIAVLPALGLLAVLFAYPVTAILVRSFTDFVDAPRDALENYRWFVENSVNVRVLLRTLATAGLVTLVCLLLGYPYAYLMTTVGPRARLLLIGAVLVPFWTSFIVRNYAWLVLLGDNGVVNDALAALRLPRVELIGNLKGVTIGMAQVLLPFMVLPLYAAMSTIDRRLLQAAASLGSRPGSAFLRVYLPLSLPGVLSGALLVFVLALGFYITPAMLGSPQNSLLSQLIVTQVNVLLAWGRGGAMAAVLLVVTLALLWVAARTARPARARLESRVEP